MISTDYDQYAVVYGCDVYLGVFKLSYATLLSRSTYAELPAVTSAKDKLYEIGYPYNQQWVKAGEKCGWDAALTWDEQMVASIMAQNPTWDDYTEGANRGRFQELYNPDAQTDIVTGFLGTKEYANK